MAASYREFGDPPHETSRPVCLLVAQSEPRPAGSPADYKVGKEEWGSELGPSVLAGYRPDVYKCYMGATTYHSDCVWPPEERDALQALAVTTNISQSHICLGRPKKELNNTNDHL
jgi:hypothetical protein